MTIQIHYHRTRDLRLMKKFLIILASIFPCIYMQEIISNKALPESLFNEMDNSFQAKVALNNRLHDHIEKCYEPTNRGYGENIGAISWLDYISYRCLWHIF